MLSRLLANLLLSLLLAAPVAAQSGGQHASAKKQARAAAEAWLDRIDADAFGESWDEAAAVLQKRIKREDWVRKAKRLRDTVKTVTSRTLAMTQYRDSISRAPTDGPFVVLKYRSTSETGRFDELLLTVRDDTTWKVAGYQVTPLRRSSAAPDSLSR